MNVLCLPLGSLRVPAVLPEHRATISLLERVVTLGLTHACLPAR